MNRKEIQSTTFDATYAERIKLLEASPEAYFRKYPRPTFGFQAKGGDDHASRSRN